MTIAEEPKSVAKEGDRKPRQSSVGGGRTRRRLKRIAIVTVVLVMVAGIGMALALRQMRAADEHHASFLACGSTISSFLKAYAASLGTAIETNDLAPLLAMYSDHYRSPGRGHWSFDGGRDLGNVVYMTLQKHGSDRFDRAALRPELAEYLAGPTAVDRVECKINLIEKVQPGEAARLTVKYVLDGRDTEGRLFQDRFFFRWWLESATGDEGLDGWRIVRDELVEGVRVAGKADGFERLVLSEIGIDFVHRRDPKLNAADPNVRLKFAVIEHAGGGVCAVDYDDDGRADLFFADGVRSRLYRNVGPSATSPVSFVDVTTIAGLDNLDQAHGGLFADVDNDGDKDLFVARYMAPSRLYRNGGDGTFTDVSSGSGLDFVEPATSSCFFDYDNDGLVDLYVGVNGNAFESAPDIPFYARNARPNRLFRNLGGGRFKDVTEPSRTGDTGWTLAVCAGDVNNDGRPDILVADDFGRKVVYRNEGDGTFTDVAREMGMLDFSGGMGIAVADFNDDGLLDVYTSNINSNQRWYGEDITLNQYLRNVVRTKWIFGDLPEYYELYKLLGNDWRKLGKMVGEGNSLFANNGDGTFTELKDSHTERAGWGWGVAFFDVDNDADLDIFAANGWITGEKNDDL